MKTEIFHRFETLYGLGIRSKILCKILGKKYFGLNGIDAKISKILSYRNGFFVELGAYDGIRQSNTKHLELYKGWKGILIEPHRKTYQKLKKNRAKRNKFWNVACVNSEYTENSINLAFAGLMTSAIHPSNELPDQKAHLISAKRHLKSQESIHIFSAEARTLNHVLKCSSAPSVIDFLSIDVEGSEILVLEGITFNEYSFKYILVETHSYSKLAEYLEPRGYVLFQKLSDIDFLFRKAKP